MSRTSLRRLAKRAIRTIQDVYRYYAFRFSERRGVFETFSQAEAAAPKWKKIGYDHDDVASGYRESLNLTLDSSDYPLLYHLDHVLRDQSTVLDIGGNIGVHYLRYRPYFKSASVRWIVYDVPAITKVGREACVEFPGVAFINDFSEISGNRIDVLHASDSAQYFEDWGLMLSRLIEKQMRPAHILFEQVPVYDGPQFVTLQNGGSVYYPHYVFNRKRFVGAITKLGYEITDSWSINESHCNIPFHPEKDVHALTGYCFSDPSEIRSRNSVGNVNHDAGSHCSSR
jgi:putative methyltransferase (TIGR04325 family)